MTVFMLTSRARVAGLNRALLLHGSVSSKIGARGLPAWCHRYLPCHDKNSHWVLPTPFHPQ